MNKIYLYKRFFRKSIFLIVWDYKCKLLIIININFFFLELKGEEEWIKLNYVENFDISFGIVRDNVLRQDCNKIFKLEFVERYEKLRILVVLIYIMDYWKLMRKWSVEV